MGCCNIFKLPRRKQREKPGTPIPPVPVPISDDSQEKRSEERPKSSVTTDLQSKSTGTPEPAAQSVPGRLWNLAYDQLKVKNPRLIEHYEVILSSRLDDRALDATDVDLQTNKISSGLHRSLQMRQLVDTSLERTEKEAATKEAVAQGLQIFAVVKDSVATATRASPEASVAWVPICFALDILLNPLTQASSNREGIAYVVSRMDWYWHLADLLLEDNQEVQRSQPLQEQLEKNLVELYASLLEYQVKSIITYHRRRGIVFARDLIKWDDWEGELAAIKDTEESIRQDAAQFNTLEIRDQLQTIAKKAESQDTSLHNIVSSIQEQTRRAVEDTKTAADNACLRDLYLTNPSDDKKRLEDAKGGLLDGSFRWILDNAIYQRWCEDPDMRLLWIEGAPGQGKTMLMCGIIGVLNRTVLDADLLSFFFCQNSEPHNNKASAVLRGLIHHLISQRLSLIRHVRLEYDHAGQDLFTDQNSWMALSRILTNMLDDWDIRQSNIYLMVDAVDECVVSEDRKRLLELIVQLSRKLPHVKWIISSRGWNDIRDVLADHRPMIRLALNPKSEVTLEAINTYIEYKVRALAKKKRLDPSNAAAIRDYLIDNAGGTFLWVALVCQKLEGHTGVRWKEIMQAFPPGLKELYKRMLQQIEGLDEPEANLCKFVLSVVTIAVRPLHLSELASLLKELDHITDKEAESKDILGACGSFLSLHNGRVVFVHQSAKDYLTGDARKIVFPKGQKVTHAAIVARSMQLLSQFYQKPCRPRGSYGEPPESEASVNGLLYPTAHWPSHAMRSKDKITAHLYSGQGPVCKFLRQYEQRWLDEVGLAKGHQMAADLWTEFVDKNEYPEFDDILFSMFCKLPD